ncbi:hypothetical protein NTE_02532 [Candidatus Nitrososphaera evergladensis SR1]|uniref:Uncharacterized protein n=1 Tax=Candidatus Nitrososphaera evergladensis SR1 TaxID=1459636 RepID=A0A075MZA2_9ARCH|nr:hypothetical protein [Candidatus Nitrososphaera evergladensis]AIF84579.1 hypothetical protein NTE_02532 [Candidatus Nitrososphaera evergladensis SR1]
MSTNKSINQSIHAVQTDNFGRKYQFVQNDISNLALEGREERVVIDQKESGELYLFELHGNYRYLGLNVEIWGTSGAGVSIQQGHETFVDLITKNWGVGAGEVAPVAGISPDPAGKSNPRHPYILRYKSTEEADITGQEGQKYSLAFTPIPYTPYASRIRVTLVNRGSEVGIIEDFAITRKVWL